MLEPATESDKRLIDEFGRRSELCEAGSVYLNRPAPAFGLESRVQDSLQFTIHDFLPELLESVGVGALDGYAKSMPTPRGDCLLALQDLRVHESTT